MSLEKEILNDFPRFFIGTIKTENGIKSYWTNIALDSEIGKVTDADLLGMSDEQLEKMAFSENGAVRTEQYRRPMSTKVAEKQGGYAGEVYEGVHRAVIVLEYRRKSKIRESVERNRTEKEAINSLAQNDIPF